MVKRSKVDEIVNRMRLDDELIRRLQLNRGPEVSEAEGDCTAIVNVAWVAKQTNPGISPVLDYPRRRTQRRRIALGVGIHSEFA